MSRKEDRFRDYLKSKKLKFTPQRRIILREAFSTHRHFEVDELFIRIRTRDKRLSRSTLYRTLKLLVESGLLKEVILGEKHRHFEHMFGHDHHDHLLCLRCGRIIEFTNQLIESWQAKVCKKHRFHPQSHRLQISGYCQKCQKKFKS